MVADLFALAWFFADDVLDSIHHALGSRKYPVSECGVHAAPWSMAVTLGCHEFFKTRIRAQDMLWLRLNSPIHWLDRLGLFKYAASCVCLTRASCLTHLLDTSVQSSKTCNLSPTFNTTLIAIEHTAKQPAESRKL